MPAPYSKKKQFGNRSLQRNALRAYEPLEDRRLLTALSPANLLVSSTNNYQVSEYTDAGALVQSLPLSILTGGRARDISVDASGDIATFVGDSFTSLQTINPTTGTVNVAGISGWSTINQPANGGLVDYGNFVFVTDQDTPTRPEQGLIRFDTTDNSFQRFATDEGFVDLTMGHDGLLYALEEDTGQNIRAYDRDTLAQVGTTVSLPTGDHQGIAVNPSGQIFTARSNGDISQYDSAGNLLNTASSTVGDLIDIDLHSDGRIVASSSSGDVVRTDTNLSAVSTFSAESGPVFVAFADDDPVSGPNEAPTAFDQSIPVVEDEVASFSLLATDESPDSNLTYTITSLDFSGTVSFGGVPVTVGQTFLGAPQLEFEFAADNPEPFNAMKFTVTDDGAPPLTSEETFVFFESIEAVGENQVTIDGNGVVRVGGTSGVDNFVIKASGSNLQVKRNGSTISNSIPLASVTEIRGWGREGDDKFNVNKNLAIDTILFGGEGNDRLYGGAGRDLLFGGNGDDILRGRNGDDWLGGGAGEDDIRANNNDDVLVGGSVLLVTIQDADAILTDWSANHDTTNLDSIFAWTIDDEYDYVRGGGNLDLLVVSDDDNHNTGSDTVLII